MFAINVVIFPHINKKLRRKFRSDNSRMKKDIQSRFSGLTRKINLSYLLWKPKLLKSIFGSRFCFVKLSTNRNKLSIVKAQSWQRREMYKIVFVNYFSFQSWKNLNLTEKTYYYPFRFLFSLALLTKQFFLYFNLFWFKLVFSHKFW